MANLPANLPLGRQADKSFVQGTPPGDPWPRYNLPAFEGRVSPDESDIEFNAQKFLQMPAMAKCRIVDYGERFRDDDSQSFAIWDIPYSVRLQWKAFALGYATIKLRNEGGARPRKVFSRIPPMQHPEMPWQYAQEIEMLDKYGHIVHRDDIIITEVVPNDLIEDEDFLQTIDGLPNAAPPAPPDPAGRQSVLAADGMSAFIPWPCWVEPNMKDGSFDDGICRYRVTYKDVDFVVYTDEQMEANNFPEWSRYVQIGRNNAIKALHIPNSALGRLKFAEGPEGIKTKAIDQGGLILRPVVTWEYKWIGTPYYPQSSISNCVGCVNGNEFDGMPPGSLLCQSPQVKRYHNNVGRLVYDVTFRFDEDCGQARSWNHYPAGDGKFYLATLEGVAGENTIYKYRPFDLLFNANV